MRSTGNRYARLVRGTLTACAVTSLMLACAAAREDRTPPDLATVLAPYSSLAPGSPGNRALAEAVNSRFAASGYEHGVLRVETPVFVPGRTTVQLPDGPPDRLFPMHPTLLRPGNFPEEQFTAPLVYLGRGTPRDLRRVQGRPLDGAVAVMEFDCGDRWISFMRFGLRGVIFLAADGYEILDAHAKVYNTEAPAPRFFAPEPAATRLRNACTNASPDAVFEAEPSRCRSEVLISPWVLIPGAEPELARHVVLLTAPLDANGVVPELADGRDRLCNLEILLKLLDGWRDRPPAHSVLLAAVNGHTQCYLGERLLAWHLLAPYDDITQLRDTLARNARIAELIAGKYSELGLRAPDAAPEELDLAVSLLTVLARDDLPVETGSAISVARLREALDRALAEVEERRTSLFGRLATNPEQAGSLDKETQAFREAKQWSDQRLLDTVRRAQHVFEDEQRLEEWRAAMDTSTGVRIAVKERLQEAVKRELNVVKMEIMNLSRTMGEAPARADELTPRIEQLRAQRETLRHVLILFNKIDIGVGRTRTRYREIAAVDAQRDLLAGFRDGLVEKLTESAGRYRQMLEDDEDNGQIRNVLGTRVPRLAIALNTSASARQSGFCSINRRGKEGWLHELGLLTADLAEDIDPLPDGRTPFVDSLSGSGGLPEEHFFVDWESPAIVFHAAQRLPAVALKPVFEPIRNTCIPAAGDATSGPSMAEPVARWLVTFLQNVVDHPDLTTDRTCARVPGGVPQLWSCVVKTFEMDEFAPQPVPDLPVPDALIAAYATAGAGPLPSFIDGDVAYAFTAQADSTGHAILYGLWEPHLAPLAYCLDERAVRVVSSIDKGRIQESKQISSNLYRSQSKTLPMFPCREFIVYDRVDPSALGSRPILLQGLWPKSAKSLADPDKYGVHGVGSLSKAASHMSRGPASVCLQRKRSGFMQEALMLLTANEQFTVHSTTDKPEGIGFATSKDLGPDLFLRIAHDMDRVCRHRLANMRGVVNELVRQFLAASREALDDAARNLEARDYTAYLRSIDAALGNATKAYRQIRSMNADMLKAIIVYMALMLPFCYFLQKLLLNTTRLEHEIMAFLGMFFATYTGFRLIHPAFAIAMSPEAIFIAFVLGAIGCFATWILHGRFSAEMDLLFRGVIGFGNDAAGAGFVGQTAMLIGVNNMKRRRTRTVLTTATVVLVVFTILAFSSVSQSIKPTLVKREGAAPYTGLFYTWPGGAPMDEDSVQVLETLYGHRASLLVRRVHRPEPVQAGGGVRWRIERAEDARRSAFVSAALSLSPDEPAFVGQSPLRQGRLFDTDDTMAIILPATLAEALQIEPETVGSAAIRFMGLDLTVVGILEDDRYRMLRDLDPDTPLFPKIQAAQDLDTQGDSAGTSGMAVDLSGVVFLPDSLLQRLGGRPYSVSVRFDDGQAASDTALWQEVELLLRVADPKIVVGSTRPFKVSKEAKRATDAGVYLVGGSYRTSIGGMARLVIPLLIAGLILFNTMLGTVYERKPEIAIYNAIGLNPHHIFVFFLAEALVYGVIGSIGGYLVGQILTVTAQSLNLVRGLSVNFSSLMVVWAILFTIGLVVVSTLYPAFVATRTAVPSGTRRWSLPDHDGESMHVLLPFIYLPDSAAGVMAYLDDFFAECCEESLGDLIARPLGHERGTDDKGQAVYRTRYHAALAPYDLGVTQTVRIEANYSPTLESYELHLHIQRESGQDTSWAAVNRPLLERLRQLLLRWRNLDPAVHREFSEKARELF